MRLDEPIDRLLRACGLASFAYVRYPPAHIEAPPAPAPAAEEAARLDEPGWQGERAFDELTAPPSRPGIPAKDAASDPSADPDSARGDDIAFNRSAISAHLPEERPAAPEPVPPAAPPRPAEPAMPRPVPRIALPALRPVARPAPPPLPPAAPVAPMAAPAPPPPAQPSAPPGRRFALLDEVSALVAAQEGPAPAPAARPPEPAPLPAAPPSPVPSSRPRLRVRRVPLPGKGA